MDTDWRLIKVTLGNGRTIIYPVNDLGLILMKNAEEIMERCEELSSTDACCSQRLDGELYGQDSQGRGVSL